MNPRYLMLALGLAGTPVAANAYDLPAVNLGGTSFYDGAPAPSGNGWYLVEYLQSISASRLTDNKGDSLGLPKEKIDLFVPLTQIIYVPETRWGDITPGWTVLLPWVSKAEVDDGLHNTAIAAQTGIGDTTIGGYLQFAPIMGTNGPVFSQRIELDVSLPTGQYDPDLAINPGSNTLSLNPYYAATYWASPGMSFSGRLLYLWNAGNNDPATSLAARHNSQAGQALHANLTAEYAVTPQLTLGLNGYWLNQITDTRVDGEAVKGRKEKVWAAGPGLLYGLNADNIIFVNSYFEHGAQNRAEGNRLVVRLVHHF
jgi:hypothetical protein